MKQHREASAGHQGSRPLSVGQSVLLGDTLVQGLCSPKQASPHSLGRKNEGQVPAGYGSGARGTAFGCLQLFIFPYLSKAHRIKEQSRGLLERPHPTFLFYKSGHKTQCRTRELAATPACTDTTHPASGRL